MLFQDKTFSLWEFIPASPCFAWRLARWLWVGQKIRLLKGSATALGVSGLENYGNLKLMLFDKVSGVWHMDRMCFYKFIYYPTHCWLCCDDWSLQGRNRKGHQGLGWITSQHEGLEPALSQQVSALQDASDCKCPNSSLTILTILTLAKHTCTVPYHGDVRSVKDGRSSSLQAWTPRDTTLFSTNSYSSYCLAADCSICNSWLIMLDHVWPKIQQWEVEPSKPFHTVLIILSGLGYGNRGIGPIPPGSTLPGINTSWWHLLPAIDHVMIMYLLLKFHPIHSNPFQSSPIHSNPQESIAFIWHPRLYFDVELKSIVTRWN